MDKGLVELLPVSGPVAFLAENDALRDFGKASFLGPRPDSVIVLLRRIEMMQLKAMATAAFSAQLAREERPASLSDPAGCVGP